MILPKFNTLNLPFNRESSNANAKVDQNLVTIINQNS